ncbi:uncharacterized protein DS421_12g385140 [Arachis hypogaea]|nr:uncharacterized protein DS421_12g385140 [Arachis hypogaea]
MTSSSTPTPSTLSSPLLPPVSTPGSLTLSTTIPPPPPPPLSSSASTSSGVLTPTATPTTQSPLSSSASATAASSFRSFTPLRFRSLLLTSLLTRDTLFSAWESRRTWRSFWKTTTST